MKKWITAGLAVLLLTIVGGTVMASGQSEWNFEERLPFMQERHPGVSESELEEWFNECRIRYENGERGPGSGMGPGMMGRGNGFGPGNGEGYGPGNGPHWGNGPANGFGPRNGNSFGPANSAD